MGLNSFFTVSPTTNHWNLLVQESPGITRSAWRLQLLRTRTSIHISSSECLSEASHSASHSLVKSVPEQQKHSGPVLSVLRLWSQRVVGSKPERSRGPAEGSPVGPAHPQPVAGPQALHPQPQALVQHVGGGSVGQAQTAVGPVGVRPRGRQHHRGHVPAWGVEGELWGGAGLGRGGG